MKLAAVVAAALLLAPSPAQDDFEIPADWLEPVAPFRIAGNLHYVGTAELTAFLLVSDEGHVLIDAPMDENVDLILANIRALGFDPRDVRVQLASHGHFDHTGGIAALVEATGAELVLSEPAAELVGNGGRGGFFDLGVTGEFPPASADRTVGHLETVAVGPTTLTAHLTPGHTRGCTSWSGTVTEAGEELTFVSVCSLSVLDGYRLVGEAPSYPGIARDFCSSERHLRSLQPDIFLSSHGSFIGLRDKMAALEAGDRRAFVDPDRYVRYLDRSRRQIERVLDEQGHTGGCEAILADG